MTGHPLDYYGMDLMSLGTSLTEARLDHLGQTEAKVTALDTRISRIIETMDNFCNERK